MTQDNNQHEKVSAPKEDQKSEEVGQDHVRQVILSQHLCVMENIIEKLLVFGGLLQSSTRLLLKFASVYLVKHL